VCSPRCLPRCIAPLHTRWSRPSSPTTGSRSRQGKGCRSPGSRSRTRFQAGKAQLRWSLQPGDSTCHPQACTRPGTWLTSLRRSRTAQLGTVCKKRTQTRSRKTQRGIRCRPHCLGCCRYQGCTRLSTREREGKWRRHRFQLHTRTGKWEGGRKGRPCQAAGRAGDNI
jgi:hypothetical protein